MVFLKWINDPLPLNNTRISLIINDVICNINIIFDYTLKIIKIYIYSKITNIELSIIEITVTNDMLKMAENDFDSYILSNILKQKFDDDIIKNENEIAIYNLIPKENLYDVNRCKKCNQFYNINLKKQRECCCIRCYIIQEQTIQSPAIQYQSPVKSPVIQSQSTVIKSPVIQSQSPAIKSPSKKKINNWIIFNKLHQSYIRNTYQERNLKKRTDIIREIWFQMDIVEKNEYKNPLINKLVDKNIIEKIYKNYILI